MTPALRAVLMGRRTIDLFVIVGQSNAEGRGLTASSPPSPFGVYITGSTITAPLADPVGGADTGSMWPAFSNEWKNQTGRYSAFVESATGGTPLLPDAAGSNWSPSGSLRAAAVTAANNAIAAIRASSRYRLGNVYFVWSQGEQDAVTINGTTITGPLYEAALETLAAYFKTNVPEMVTMAVVQTGGEFDQSDEANYAAIRLAQENACTDSANLVMAYRGAFSFTARAMMGDNVHYSQAGLNITGACAARGLANGAAIPAAPAVLAATAYADPAYTAAAGRAANHTTAVGTKMLVVAVSAMRPEANTTYFLDSVTFGGVALTLCSAEKASSSAATAGRVNTSIWYLNETTYGASLSEVTASLSVNDTASINIVDWCAIDCDAEGMLESFYFDAATPADKDAGTVALYTNAPALVIGAGSSAATTGAVLTATLTNLTEAMDHGITNAGATRAGQFVAGYAAEAAIVNAKSYTATWTATCTALSWVVAAFRGKVSGE
jgi:hypothetical protein